MPAAALTETDPPAAARTRRVFYLFIFLTRLLLKLSLGAVRALHSPRVNSRDGGERAAVRDAEMIECAEWTPGGTS